MRLRAQFVRTVWVASTQDSTGLPRPRIIVPRKYSHTVQAPQLEGGPHYAGYATQRSLGGWQRLHAYYNRGLRIKEVNYNAPRVCAANHDIKHHTPNEGDASAGAAHTISVT